MNNNPPPPKMSSKQMDHVDLVYSLRDSITRLKAKNKALKDENARLKKELRDE